jgi:predicted NBD/HSP70 family sugar kinase
MSEQADVDATGHGSALPVTARRLLLEILIHGPLSRVELARRLGLSGPSLTRLTKPLITAGTLIEQRPLVAPLGRPQLPLDLDSAAELFAGVKITADASYTVVTDLRGSIRAERNSLLPGHDPGEVADVVARDVTALAEALGAPSAVGVSLGGRTADGRVIAESNFLQWRDVPFADEVERRVHAPVVIANDVNALTQAQHWFGAGRGLDSFAVVTIGAGIGLGVVAHGALVTGVHGAAGTVGHQLLRWSDAVCWRGHHGCASALLTTGALERAAAERVAVRDAVGDAATAGASARHAGGAALDYATILQRAAGGDPDMRAVVDDAAEALGLLLASIANTFDPQKIVLAGEGARLGEVGDHAMRRSFESTKAWASAITPIEVQPFAFNEWARGAAVTAIQSRYAVD